MNLDGACAHIQALEAVTQPKKRECEDCARASGHWVHLRTCQACGGTRCCDSSPQQHASKHAKSSRHPVICSAEPGENWLYCYRDDDFVEY